MPNWPIGLDFGSDTTSPWGGSPSSQGAGAYGGIPRLPRYGEDTTTQTGPDVYAQLTRNLPGYQSMVAKSSGNIGGNLKGQISPDVIAMMQQQAAERGIATGTEGSQANNAAYLRALGLTSMQLQQLGESQLTAAVGRTPIQQIQTGVARTDLAPQQAIYNAAPNPQLAAEAAIGAGLSGMGIGRGAGSPVSYPTAPIAPITQMGYTHPSAPTTPGGGTTKSMYPGWQWDETGQLVPEPWGTGFAMSQFPGGGGDRGYSYTGGSLYGMSPDEMDMLTGLTPGGLDLTGAATQTDEFGYTL